MESWETPKNLDGEIGRRREILLYSSLENRRVDKAWPELVEGQSVSTSNVPFFHVISLLCPSIFPFPRYSNIPFIQSHGCYDINIFWGGCIDLNVAEKLFQQTRRGHWRSLEAEPFECEAPRSGNFAGLHSW